MEKVLPHLSALLFVLSCEIIAWSADIQPTSSPGNLIVLSVFSNEGDQLSSAILEIIWSQPTLHFFKSAIMYFLILVDFCVGEGSVGSVFCTSISKLFLCNHSG